MPKSYTVKNQSTVVEGLKDQNGNWTSGPFTRTRTANGRKLAILVSTNNKRSRPWSNYSIVKTQTSGPWYRTHYWGQWSEVVDGKTIWHQYYRGFLSSDNPYSVDDTSTFPGSVETEASAIALAKLVNSLNEERTQWSFATSLGEARETASGIASTARRLASGMLALRRGNFKGAYRHLTGHNPSRSRNRAFRKKFTDKGSAADAVSSAWLELSYAWLPLLGDIDSAARYIAEKRFKHTEPAEAVSRAHTSERYSVSTTGSGGNPIYRTLTSEISRVRYTFEVLPNFSRNFSTMEELGFTDPFGVAWDLLPLSFVVDWFINVGQVLESLHTFSQWKVKRGIYATRNSLERERTLSKNFTSPLMADGNPYNRVEDGEFFTFLRQWSKRQLYSNFPTSIPLRVVVDNPFDLKGRQMASAVALLQKAFS